MSGIYVSSYRESFWIDNIFDQLSYVLIGSYFLFVSYNDIDPISRRPDASKYPSEAKLQVKSMLLDAKLK